MSTQDSPLCLWRTGLRLIFRPVRQSLGQPPALRRTVVSHYAVPHVRVARIQAGAPRMQTSGCVRRSAGGKNNAKSNNLSDYVPDAERPGLLRERMAAGRPGAGVPAQENAQGGVQLEHRRQKAKSGAVTGDPPETPYLFLWAAARVCPLVSRPSVRAPDGANYGGFDNDN